MPQVWVTDEELARAVGLDHWGEARDFALRRGWTRKRSRDGRSRSMVPADIVPDLVGRLFGLIQAGRVRPRFVAMRELDAVTSPSASAGSAH